MAGLIHGIEPAKVAANLERVREAAGGEVEILAATKYVPLEEMGALAEAGISLVGENRQQDLAAKHARWGEAFEWDFIGNLQSRKVKQLLPICRLIHSVATESALEQLGAPRPPRHRGADRGQRRRRRGEERGRPRGARRVHRALSGTGIRPDDDAAVQPGPGGFQTPFRPPGRAGDRPRPQPALDGHIAGLARGGRRGCDDRPPRRRLICVNPRYLGHNAWRTRPGKAETRR